MIDAPGTCTVTTRCRSSGANRNWGIDSYKDFAPPELSGKAKISKRRRVSARKQPAVSLQITLGVENHFSAGLV